MNNNIEMQGISSFENTFSKQRKSKAFSGLEILKEFQNI